MPPPGQIVKKKRIYGVPASRLNPMSSKHASAIPAMKRNIATGLRSVLGDKHPYQMDLAERIPREEIDHHLAFIGRLVPSMTPAGSYRRGAVTSADIDIIVREPIADVVARLQAAGYIHHTFGAGDRKFSGIVRLGKSHARFRHLDIVFTTPRSYPFTLLYFTGPAKANIIMRVKAKRKGLKLNEYGLWRADGALVPGLKTERDIYTALGIEYKEPAAR